MARRRHAAALAIFIVVAMGAMSAEACGSRGADEEPAFDTDADAGIEASTVDAGSDATSPRARCAVDSDCKAPNGCYTPHCDGVLGACTFSLCEPKGRNCAQGRCDANLTCGEPKDYGLRTTSYRVEGASLGCSASASRCFAAVHPFAEGSP